MHNLSFYAILHDKTFCTWRVPRDSENFITIFLHLKFDTSHVHNLECIYANETKIAQNDNTTEVVYSTDIIYE